MNLVDRFAGASRLEDPFRDARRWNELVKELGHPDWRADLVLVDDDAMARLNEAYRGKAAVTDVLSFSYLLEIGQGDPALAQGRSGAAQDLWLDPFETTGDSIGEILLAPDFVTRRCRERGWPIEHELPLLVVHGCLHLLGWDHEEAQQGARMRAVETRLLEAAGVPHPLAGK